MLTTPSNPSDSELVTSARAGDRASFAAIVARYQTLICSVAYSATGDVNRSEDVAQETFLAAWRGLAKLEEPGKLRSWLCSIARRRTQDELRAEQHEPVRDAEPIEATSAVAAAETVPSEQSLREDELALVWRSLRQIPETYREPLVLYYRGHQSVEQVAAALDLTEEAVRQRLVRGRAMLQSEVARVVEGALDRTKPDRRFTQMVMEAIPVHTLMGAAALKSSLTAAGLLLKVVATPLAIVYAERQIGLVAEEDAMTQEEKRFWRGHRRSFLAGIVILLAVMVVFNRFHATKKSPYGWLFVGVFLVAFILWLVSRIRTRRRTLTRIWAQTGTRPAVPMWEFRSRSELLGLPLLHIRIRRNPLIPAVEPPVRGWIAVGNIAYGRIFAAGLVAIAPVSIGVVGVGLVTFGLCALGVLSGGIYAAGVWVFADSVAIGIFASALVVAIGWSTANASAAYSFHYAKWFPLMKALHVTLAPHAGDAAARDYFQSHPFLSASLENVHQAKLENLALFYVTAASLLLWTCWAGFHFHRRARARRLR